MVRENHSGDLTGKPDFRLKNYPSKLAFSELTEYIRTCISRKKSYSDIPNEKLKLFLADEKRVNLLLSQLIPDNISFIADAAVQFFNLRLISPILQIIDNQSQLRHYVLKSEDEIDLFYAVPIKRIQLRLTHLRKDSALDSGPYQDRSTPFYNPHSNSELISMLRGEIPMPAEEIYPSNIDQVDLPKIQNLGTAKENQKHILKRSLNVIGLLPYSANWLKKHYVAAFEGML